MDDRELREDLLPRLVELGTEPVDPNLVAAYVDDALPTEDALATWVAVIAASVAHGLSQCPAPASRRSTTTRSANPSATIRVSNSW